jgi:dienelactone hydrolase
MSPHRFAAAFREALVSLPVTVALANGSRVTTEFQLTHARPPGAGPFPLVVVQHGRGEDNAYPSRFGIGSFAAYFLRRGFAVLVPTRAGYGGLGAAIDPERGTGACTLAGIELQSAAVIAHTRAALAFAANEPWADARRVLLAGGSVGGYSTIAAASQGIPGVFAAINFAGGAGGSGKKNPGNPCNPERLSAFMTKAGAGAKVPTLWIYSQNDKYWGEQHPRAWHAAYVKAGGQAKLVMLPPVGEDGHFVTTAGFQHWRPVADRFLASFGIVPPATRDPPPPTDFAPLEAADKVPANERARNGGYQHFLAGDLPRAFVIGPNGGWHYRTGRPDALDAALGACREAARLECKPYAVDDRVVWKP